MIDKTAKEDVGAWSEAEIQRSLDQAFGVDFVFRSPQRSDVNEEATDVLVLFDDTAIIIESKSRAHDKLAATQFDPDTRWASKAIAKAFDPQLRRATRLFQAGKFAAVTNKRRRSVAIDPNQFPHVYGLIIVNHESAPYYAEDLVPQLRDSPIPTIVLSLTDLIGLSRYLNTPYDLINYLETRYEKLHDSLDARVHEEQAAFEFYASNFEYILESRLGTSGTKSDSKNLAEQANLWRAAMMGQLADAGFARFFDKMLDQLHLGQDLPVEVPGLGKWSSDYSKAATHSLATVASAESD